MTRIINGSSQTPLLFLVFMLVVLRTECVLRVDITYVQSAVAKGAVCLDGSPPAYFFDKGSGSGANKWLIKLAGGGWCNNVTSCSRRRGTPFGSTTLLDKQFNFTGILNNLEEHNPDFYNWNRISIAYCDGASFTGDIEEVNPITKLYFRGARIIPVVIEDLLAKGLSNAENAILSGCSAGGLSAMLHCDRFTSLLPNFTKVKCFPDAGFFINAKDVSGAPTIEKYFDDVAATHGSAKNLPVSCTSKMKPGLCFFPENFIQGIKTPLFILNSAMDTWQIGNILVPPQADPSGVWNNCKSNLANCTVTQLQRLQEFRLELLNKFSGLGNSTSRGSFINSCFEHCQAKFDEYWFGSTSPMINNKTMAAVVGDWYFDRTSPFNGIGLPYPDDKTCKSV